jgi:hypothetical protein
VADKIESHNPLRGYLDIIIKECPVVEFNEIRKQTDKTGGILYPTFPRFTTFSNDLLLFLFIFVIFTFYLVIELYTYD